MRGGWADNPDEVIVVIQDTAAEWKTVEEAEKVRSKSRGTKNKEDASSQFGGGAKQLEVEKIEARRISLW